MENIQEWFLALDTNLQIYWIAAIISSLLFLIQTVMTFIGIDSDVDVDVDFDGDTTDFGGLSLFSVRGLVNFLLGFGWSGVTLWKHVDNIYVLYVCSIAVGFVLAFVCLLILKSLKKLEKNGVYNPKDAIGQTCSVYLRIPNNRTGRGKVQISIGGAIHEIGAMTDGEEIPTGSMVRVISLLDNSTYLVSSAN